jgi:hypothetical protein
MEHGYVEPNLCQTKRNYQPQKTTKKHKKPLVTTRVLE